MSMYKTSLCYFVIYRLILLKDHLYRFDTILSNNGIYSRILKDSLYSKLLLQTSVFASSLYNNIKMLLNIICLKLKHMHLLEVNF